MTETKVCQYKPCSQVFSRQDNEKQWHNKRFCSADCQHKNNAEQTYLRYKAKQKTFRHYAEQKIRTAPQIKNPQFWDRILTKALA